MWANIRLQPTAILRIMRPLRLMRRRWAELSMGNT